MAEPDTWLESGSKVTVDLGDRSYDILIGRDLIKRIGKLIAERFSGARIAIVTDETVAHLHLNHLVQQGEHYRTRVFEPAQIVFDLTLKAYASGEVEILSLIDANNIYFDTRGRYLELLQEAWLEAAEVRLAAGRTLVTTEQDTYHD